MKFWHSIDVVSDLQLCAPFTPEQPFRDRDPEVE